MRKILLTFGSILALLALVACGGGSSSSTPVPSGPSGGNNAGYSNASLTGNYVFSANGVTSNASFATVGVFAADGAGNITSGIRDTVNDGGGQILGEAISGTYSVNQDGRGQAVLNGSSGQVIYRFTLQSSAAGKLFQISNTADATGRLELQSSVPTSISGTYIVRLDGEDSNSNRYPYAAIGGLNFSGTAIAGQVDENDAGNFSAQLSASGSYANLTSNGRGSATYTTSTGTHNFVFYALPNRIEMISTDKNFFLHGYADLQTSFNSSTAAFLGDQVFNISGFTSNGQILETGRLTLDGQGNVTNAIEDYNEAGTYFDSVSFGGSYAVSTNGRWTGSFAYSSSTLGLVGWQVSPQQSIVLTTTSSISGYSILETGTMRTQTTGLTTASVTGNYAENLSGYYVGSGNVETGGNFLADGNGNLSGTIDSQTPGAISTDVGTTGSYAVATNGRSTGTIGSVPVHVYTVDANTIYLIPIDSNRMYQGMMVKQQ
jgi:hypothetical protein